VEGIESIKLFFQKGIHKKTGTIRELVKYAVFQDKNFFLFFPHFFSKGVSWEFGTRIGVSSKKRLDVLAYLLLAVKCSFGTKVKK